MNWGRCQVFETNRNRAEWYCWRSSLNGTIRTQATLTINNLQAGTHYIYLRVEDNQGTWSQEVSTVLTIATLTNSGTGFLGLPTFYWILLAIALAGVGVFIGYFVIFKKMRKHPTGKPVVAPLAQGPMDPI